MAKPLFIPAVLERPHPPVDLLAINMSNVIADIFDITHEGVVNDTIETLGVGGSWMEVGTMGIAQQVGGSDLIALNVGESRWVDGVEFEIGNPYDDLTDPALFDISEIPAPLVPNNLLASPGDESVTLSWDPDPDTIHFNVYRSVRSDGGFVLVGTSTGPVFIDTGLINGTTYYYKVSGVNNGGEGPKAGPVSATPASPVPFEVISMFNFETEVLTYMANWSGLAGRVLYGLKLEPGGPRDLSSPLSRIGHPKALLIQSYDNEFSHDIGPGFSSASSKFVFMDLNENVPISLRLQCTEETHLLVIVAGDP